ncbi:MAG: hypothetical protein LBD13_05130 [Spirochaetaceae bacterium]|nr:hypothetical protein [Spirochaetaceae bacterium]
MTKQSRFTGYVPVKNLVLGSPAVKKALSFGALALVSALAGTGLLYGQTIQPPSPPPPITPIPPTMPPEASGYIPTLPLPSSAGLPAVKGGALGLQRSPKSVVKKASYRFGTDIDNYLGVTDWQGVEFEKLFIFLGGDASAGNGEVQAGFATKIGANHLGLYYSGNFADGEGFNNDSNPEGTYSRGIWKNNLAILFGSSGIGGIRFDLLFNPTYTDGKTGGDGKLTSGQGETVTSLQWGKSFGDLTPKVTIGFQWPEHILIEPNGGQKMEWWDNARLGLQVEIGYKAFSADYQLTIDFGETGKYDGNDYTHTGYVHNDLNLYYGITGKVDEKLTVKFQPQLNFQLYDHDGKYEYGGFSGTDPAGGLIQFQFAPIVQVGAQYALKPTVNLYAGISATLFNVDARGAFDAPGGTSPSETRVAALTELGGNLGVQLNPSKALSVELSLDGVFDVTDGTWNLDFGNLGGGLAVIFKPGAAGAKE